MLTNLHPARLLFPGLTDEWWDGMQVLKCEAEALVLQKWTWQRKTVLFVEGGRLSRLNLSGQIVPKEGFQSFSVEAGDQFHNTI